MDAGEPAALQTFLLTKLHTLGPTDKAQVQVFSGSAVDSNGRIEQEI